METATQLSLCGKMFPELSVQTAEKISGPCWKNWSESHSRTFQYLDLSDGQKQGLSGGPDGLWPGEPSTLNFGGVPQRRRRIALVVDFGGQRAGEILFERKGVRGDSEPRVPPWQGVAKNPAGSTSGHDRVVEDPAAYTLKIRSGCAGGGKGALVQKEKSATLSTLQDQTLFVLAGNMIDRETAQNGAGFAKRETMYALNATDRHGVFCAAFSAGAGSKANGIGYEEERAPTLRTSGGLSAMPTVLCRAGSALNSATINDCSPTLTCQHDGAPIVFENRRKEESCLSPWDNQSRRVYSENGTFPALSARECAGANQQAVVQKRNICWIVRRLMPVECERLQGFPDGWTDIGDWVDSKGKHHKAADRPRYRALGNSIALPQWWWLVCKMAKFLPERATLGSLFDGIGGFPLVWETLHGKGTAVWASEIEEFPIAVTKAHFPEVDV